MAGNDFDDDDEDEVKDHYLICSCFYCFHNFILNLILVSLNSHFLKQMPRKWRTV